MFAQEPVFKGTEKEQMVIRRAIFAATEKEGVDVLGTAPYVEETVEKAKKNMEWCVDMGGCTVCALLYCSISSLSEIFFGADVAHQSDSNAAPKAP